MPEIADPTHKLVITQRWDVPKGIKVTRSGDTIVVPFGRAHFINPYSWRSIILPWKVKPCRSCNILNTSNIKYLISSFSIGKEGEIKIQVFNGSSFSVPIGAKSAAVRIFGATDFEVRLLPNTPQSSANGVVIVKNAKTILGNSSDDIKKSMEQQFPSVFDLSSHPILPPMKPLKVRCTEVLPSHPIPVEGGIQTSYKIDTIVKQSDIDEALQDYENKGYIQRIDPRSKVFLSPLIPLYKPNGTVRIVNDFRLINSYFSTKNRTQVDCLRIIRQIPPSWRWFSVLDLKDGFFSLPLEEGLSQYFAFQVGIRRWKYKRLPQGWSYSPIIFMERIGYIVEGTGCIQFADDLLVGGPTKEEHHAQLYHVLARLSRFGLKINLQKARILQSSVKYLGYTLSAGQWTLSPYLNDKLQQLGPIGSRKDLEKHIGILSFCRTHVPHIESVMIPLRKFLKVAQSRQVTESEWKAITTSVHTAYEKALKSAVPLSLSNCQFSQFLLYTDWTDHRMGYLLFGVKVSHGSECLLDLGSSTVTDVTSSSFLGELRGIVYALKHTKTLRGWSSTILYSDNRAVVERLQEGKAYEDDCRVLRCIDYLACNEPNVEYRFVPGLDNPGADALSRLQGTPVATVSAIQYDFSEVPSQNDRDRMIAQGHFGHWSAEVTYRNVLMEYGSWKGMKHHITDFVNRCPHCAFSSSSQIRDVPRVDVATYMGERVHLDHAGPLFDGSYIIVLVDAATKFVTTQLVNTTAAGPAIQLLESWIQSWGPIITLVVDNAASWNSLRFLDWIDRYHVQLRISPSYYHEGNSLAERTIQTLSHRIRRFLNGSTRGWPLVLESATHALNISWNSATKTCPQLLTSGRSRSGVLVSEEAFNRSWDNAIQTQTLSQHYEKSRFEWKHPRRSAELAVSQQVLLRNPTFRQGRLGKLSPLWTGPYYIVSRRSQSIWVLSRELENTPLFTAHSSQIKPYYP